jgi:hypothetical protein
MGLNLWHFDLLQFSAKNYNYPSKNLDDWQPLKKVVIQVGCKRIKNLQLLHFRLISQELPIELTTDYGKVWKIQHDDTSGNGDSIKDRWNVDFGKPIVTYIPTNHTTPHELNKTTFVHTTLNTNVSHMQKHDH